MELFLLNTDLIAVSVLDSFESTIWTERYSRAGDFEIYTPLTNSVLSALEPDYYILSRDSDRVMIIEHREIYSDVETGVHLTVRGRSLESILDRRIIWSQTILNGNLQDSIAQLLNENIIAPSITERTVSNFVFEASTDPVITALTVKAQYNGDNLYDAVVALCEAASIGFKITLTSDLKFKFKLYAGADRSYDQTTNPYVVFSPNFENLLNSNYVESKASLKTVTLVKGEGVGSGITTRVVNLDETITGINRREMSTDAGNISTTIDGGTLTPQEYLDELTQKGLEDLAINTVVQAFEGQVEPTRTFKYGIDFFMGDIVQIANEYGLESKSRVTEFVSSQSPSGVDVYPIFSAIE